MMKIINNTCHITVVVCVKKKYININSLGRKSLRGPSTLPLVLVEL